MTTLAVFLIILTLITLKNGAAGCLTFLFASIFAITATTILFKDGIIYGPIFALGLAIWQLVKGREFS